MPELALDRVHVYARHVDPVTGEVAQRLVEHNPFLRLSNGVAEAPIYIQHGQTFGEGGDIIPEDALPPWFYHQLEKCTDAALIAVGWKQAEQQLAQPIVYTDRKTELLGQLASLSEAQLAELLGQPAVVPPTEPSAAPLSTVGTPQTPIADIDVDDFPPDPEDELLPSIPPPAPPDDIQAERWQCPECGEIMSTRQRGSHVRWKHRVPQTPDDIHGESAIQHGPESLRAR